MTGAGLSSLFNSISLGALNTKANARIQDATGMSHFFQRNFTARQTRRGGNTLKNPWTITRPSTGRHKAAVLKPPAFLKKKIFLSTLKNISHLLQGELSTFFRPLYSSPMNILNRYHTDLNTFDPANDGKNNLLTNGPFREEPMEVIHA